ncbi:hypothetical protein LZ554_006585 [Drepanopeziza brunnea f. sp. 'monogermtubi']|nr:hypothetical protein LZ554_006585 [Drepanopeziza brunnea f. sp. 'monogermtubi']
MSVRTYVFLNRRLCSGLSPNSDTPPPLDDTRPHHHAALDKLPARPNGQNAKDLDLDLRLDNSRVAIPHHSGLPGASPPRGQGLGAL